MKNVSRIESTTPDYARTVLSNTQAMEDGNVFRQRPRSERRIKGIVDKMRQDKWELSTIIIASITGVAPTGATFAPGTFPAFVLDGQHRLSALVQTGMPQEFNVIYMYFDTVEAAARQYNAIDRGAKKSDIDSQKFYGLDKRMGVTLDILRSINAALRHIAGDFNIPNSNADTLARFGITSETDRAKLPARFSTEAAAYQEFLSELKSTRERSLWLRSPVVAVFLVTARFNEAIAFPLYKAAMTNDGLRACTPEHALRRIVTDLSIGKPTTWTDRACAQCYTAACGDRWVPSKIPSVYSDKNIAIPQTPWADAAKRSGVQEKAIRKLFTDKEE